MRRIRRLLRGNSRGVTLIEALVAMAIVGIIAVAFLGGLATASRSAARADIRTNAESLARSELEYVKELHYELLPTDFPWAYYLPDNAPEWDQGRALPDVYEGYSVRVTGDLVYWDDFDIQEITVEVLYYSMYGDDPVISLSGYKVNR